jgi:hypothetical protein
VIRKKIKDINDAKSAIEHIVKIYKKIPLNDDNVIGTYHEAFTRIQKKFRGTDLSLFQIPVHGSTIEVNTKEEFENLWEELITKSEGLKEFLESKKRKI